MTKAEICRATTLQLYVRLCAIDKEGGESFRGEFRRIESELDAREVDEYATPSRLTAPPPTHPPEDTRMPTTYEAR